MQRSNTSSTPYYATPEYTQYSICCCIQPNHYQSVKKILSSLSNNKSEKHANFVLYFQKTHKKLTASFHNEIKIAHCLDNIRLFIPIQMNSVSEDSGENVESSSQTPSSSSTHRPCTLEYTGQIDTYETFTQFDKKYLGCLFSTPYILVPSVPSSISTLLKFSGFTETSRIIQENVIFNLRVFTPTSPSLSVLELPKSNFSQINVETHSSSAVVHPINALGLTNIETLDKPQETTVSSLVLGELAIECTISQFYNTLSYNSNNSSNQLNGQNPASPMSGMRFLQLSMLGTRDLTSARHSFQKLLKIADYLDEYVTWVPSPAETVKSLTKRLTETEYS